MLPCIQEVPCLNTERAAGLVCVRLYVILLSLSDEGGRSILNKVKTNFKFLSSLYLLPSNCRRHTVCFSHFRNTSKRVVLPGLTFLQMEEFPCMPCRASIISSDFRTRKWRCGGLAELQDFWLPLFQFPSKCALQSSHWKSTRSRGGLSVSKPALDTATVAKLLPLTQEKLTCHDRLAILQFLPVKTRRRYYRRLYYLSSPSGFLESLLGRFRTVEGGCEDGWDVAPNLLFFLLSNTSMMMAEKGLKMQEACLMIVYIFYWNRQPTPKKLPRMQCVRAIPVAWLGSGSCQKPAFGLNTNDDDEALNQTVHTRLLWTRLFGAKPRPASPNCHV